MQNYPAKTRYRGETASRYNDERASNPKWVREFEALNEVISKFRPNTSVLDIPVGTGRFLPLFLKNGKHTVHGMDISEDMLAEAQAVLDKEGYSANLRTGDIEDIPLAESSVDYVVCMRLMNWVPLDIVKQMIRECKRVSDDLVVLEIRVRKPVGMAQLLGRGLLDLILVRPWIGIVYNYASKAKRLLSVLRGKRSIRSQGALGYTVHREPDIESLFEDIGLVPVERHQVDSKVSYKTRELHPYYLYVLRSA